MRRIGVLMSTAADDPESPLRVAAFAQGLGELGWTVGRNVQIDYRWGGGDPERFRRSASELVALAPNVILALETTQLRTTYLSQGVRINNHYDLALAYLF